LASAALGSRKRGQHPRKKADGTQARDLLLVTRHGARRQSLRRPIAGREAHRIDSSRAQDFLARIAVHFSADGEVRELVAEVRARRDIGSRTGIWSR
jgi:hypothetical protein